MRLLVCFCYPWLSFLELQAERKQLLPPPLFLECVSPGTLLRMCFLNLHWFVLRCASEGYLFTSEGFLIPSAPTSLFQAPAGS